MKIRGFLILVLFVLLGTARGYAFLVDIPDNTFDDGHQTRNAWITNTGDRLLPLIAYVRARTQSVDGNDIVSRPDMDFTVRPRQLVLKSGESAQLTITWLPEMRAPTTNELAYQLVIEELPLRIHGPDTARSAQPVQTEKQVPIVKTVIMSLYAGTGFVSPNICITAVSPTQNAEKKWMMDILLQNSGNMHQIIQHAAFDFWPKSAPGKIVHVRPEWPDPVINILPGCKRRLRIPWPKELPVIPLEAQLFYMDSK